MTISTAASQQADSVESRKLPRIIQGGMGAAVSSWRLASQVAQAGQLGVVSGIGLDMVLARRLQDGDKGGHMRRALAAFPVPSMAARAVEEYFLPDGRTSGEPYAAVPKLVVAQERPSQELAVLGNFVEVWLAKEGHSGLVGVNYLEKVQMATPAAAYGAMLAGVDYVVMGAGLPREIPRLLNQLATHSSVKFPVDVQGAEYGTFSVSLDPSELLGVTLPPLKRPLFLAVISAHVLAEYLARDEAIRPDGFVIEGPQAGGHNAPPRGKVVLDESGEPQFGPRDYADIAKVAAIGLPFWLAGSYGTPEGLVAAQAAGAAGVQVGTLFALSHDANFEPAIRDALVAGVADGTLRVTTDLRASPTGFPFKVVELAGSLTDPGAVEERPRLCDLGFLGVPYVRDNDAVGYRCPAEPVRPFARKGGGADDTAGRLCLCNALMANVGLGQTRATGYVEKPLITLGANLDGPRRLAALHPGGWTARQALDWLLAPSDN
ncbi:nitronate monooxygenase [Demequina lutea]|uniref:NAD(P)H-dependent flavin oxidoreductase YrpB (Nitropropane dioxygenase family) n=1 Tax=Demequina lutea TaxID=431489 RepID=A0A7Z0CKC9_9MICO|nr:nitronate monooxygenase [Demequina lutea]NYI41747.1 NAD(P)H-dependent flavin oxidoreductase YrpB (nitropropane dioxygenase family) [Demequina lutea]